MVRALPCAGAGHRGGGGPVRGRLKLGKLNVEENTDVAIRYDIRTLPTLLLFKAGQVSEQRVGLISKDALARLVEPHV